MSRTMSRTTIVRRFFSSNNNSGPVTAAYLRQVEAGAVRRDASQIALATKLDSLHGELKLASSQLHRSHYKVEELRADYLKLPPHHQDSNVLTTSMTKNIASAKRQLQSFFFAPPKIPQGMYIHGTVGVGKSFLMDLFFNTLDDDDMKTCIRNKRRVHFHEFMLHVHARMFEWKKAHPHKDVVPLVAMEMLDDGQVFVLCLDEFQVTDIADAMILKRLFDILFHVGGVVVVATSNRPPEELYKGGINRSLFLPFIDTLKEQCHVIPMDTIHDYRRDTIESGTSYFFMPEDDNDGHHQESLKEIFGSTDDAEASSKKEVIPVVFGRTVKVARANKKCAWFDFRELCQEPLGAADYLAICNRFPTLILDKVPPLGRTNSYNEARRFVTLIDACYELRTRLVIAAKVPLHDLFEDFDTSLIVENIDGDEQLEMAAAGTTSLSSESWLSGKGGSSSSHSTTMIRTEDGGNMEWSATGRVGASLAQLSAVDDVSFSFKRAASRLVEMSGNQWGRQE
jgi:protein AFG1